MGTAQVDQPLIGRSDSVYEILRRSVNNQTYTGPIEVIVTDVHVDRLEREWRASWGRATRVVLSKQVHHDRIAIAAGRNTAAVFAQGELLVFVDDCTELLPSFVEAAVALYARGRIPTRLLLGSSMYPHAGEKLPTREVLRAGLAVQAFEEVDPLWRDHGHSMDGRTWKLAGHAGGVFVLDRDRFMQLNGFDENFDGNYGCEDQEFCKRLDRLGVRRRSSCDLAVVRLAHHTTPSRATLRRCRELYATWAYQAKRIAANRRLEDEVLERLRHGDPCQATCPLCTAPDRPQQAESYRTLAADFDLCRLSKRYRDRTSGVYLDPWR